MNKQKDSSGNQTSDLNQTIEIKYMYCCWMINKYNGWKHDHLKPNKTSANKQEKRTTKQKKSPQTIIMIIEEMTGKKVLKQTHTHTHTHTQTNTHTHTHTHTHAHTHKLQNMIKMNPLHLQDTYAGCTAAIICVYCLSIKQEDHHHHLALTGTILYMYWPYLATGSST